MSTTDETTLRQAAHTLTLLAQQDLGKDALGELHRYLPVLARAIKEKRIPDLKSFRSLCGEVAPLYIPQIIEVHYSYTLEEMISMRPYSHIMRGIDQETFPRIWVGTTSVKFEWKFFHFSGGASAAAAAVLISNDNCMFPWMPAQIEHLVTFAGKYSKEHYESVVAPGSISLIGEERRMPIYHGGFGGHSLSLGYSDLEFIPDVSFLAVRPIPRIGW